jgi:hypothetical protein
MQASASGIRPTSPARPRELLRPPPHRGPLIAAGAVLLTVGVALEELRLDEELGTGVHLVILAVAAFVTYALGIQARPEDGRPPAYGSVLLVCGLLLMEAALLTLSDVLGADFGAVLPAGAVVWTSLLLAAAALWPAARRNSSIAALIAAFALGVAGLAFVNWVFDATSATTYRWLLLLIAGGYVMASLMLRGPLPRHSQQMVNAAGLAILAIGLTGLVGSFFFLSPESRLPNGWEMVVLASGCGLVAYGAVERAPGPAYLGVANLVAFIAAAGPGEDATLLGWPLFVLALGIGAMIAGLRPRAPLPPEPSAYPSGTVPRAARTDDETVLRVRDDSPPTS